jgi:hypothetical protein
MIVKKGEFYTGAVMMAIFIVILIVIFLPVFKGQNGLDYLDSLYNSISKGSAYYIPALKEDVEAHTGTEVKLALKLKDETQARQTSLLLQKGGALVNVSDATLSVEGDLGRMLMVGLEDADLMYHNDGAAVAAKYGFDERQALYNWWAATNAIEKELQHQKQFKAAKFVATINKKAVETAYNFYRIEPQSIGDRYGIVIFSLIFYVVYTLWYGFAILFLFEGWGMRMEH